jgi:hypothetical protein
VQPSRTTGAGAAARRVMVSAAADDGDAAGDGGQGERAKGRVQRWQSERQNCHSLSDLASAALGAAVAAEDHDKGCGSDSYQTLQLCLQNCRCFPRSRMRSQ